MNLPVFDSREEAQEYCDKLNSGEVFMWNWQPIETAPKDREILLWYREGVSWGHPVIAHWDMDKYSKFPKPYWELRARCGKLDKRSAIYTKWHELPTDPTL